MDQTDAAALVAPVADAAKEEAVVPSAPNPAAAGAQAIKREKTIVPLRKGDMRQGIVKRILEDRGARIDIGVGTEAFLPKRQFRSRFLFNPDKLEGFQASKYLRQGETIRVWIHHLDRAKNRIHVTLVRPDFKSIHKLQVGEKRLGYVRSVLDFGAFVDVGSDKEALVPVSRLSQQRVKDIHQELQEGDELEVWITEVHKPKGEKWQINASCLPPGIMTIDDLRRGTNVTGTVKNFTKNGVLLDVQVGEDALLPLDEIAHETVTDAAAHLAVGQEIEVEITRVSSRRRVIEVSRKNMLPRPDAEDDGPHAPPPDEPYLNAMELAFKKAHREQAAAKRKRRRRKDKTVASDERADILARTLQTGA